ncbi:hypothetical protein AB5I41_17210 [Sphingomonas sp. MMS24-JH45]
MAKCAHLDHAELGYAYRTSALQHSGLIVTSARFRFPAGDTHALRREAIEILRSRRAKFPRVRADCGSVFVSDPGVLRPDRSARCGDRARRPRGTAMGTRSCRRPRQFHRQQRQGQRARRAGPHRPRPRARPCAQRDRDERRSAAPRARRHLPSRARGRRAAVSSGEFRMNAPINAIQAASSLPDDVGADEARVLEVGRSRLVGQV